jgi:hypothetical protein
VSTWTRVKTIVDASGPKQEHRKKNNAKKWFNPGSNWRPSVCKTDIITTRLLNQAHYHLSKTVKMRYYAYSMRDLVLVLVGSAGHHRRRRRPVAHPSLLYQREKRLLNTSTSSL